MASFSCLSDFKVHPYHFTPVASKKKERVRERRKEGKERRREKRGRDKLGGWDEQIHTTVYKIDKPQGPTVEHREQYSIYTTVLQ